MARNTRARVEYNRYPSIISAINDDLDEHGSVGRTSRRLSVGLGLLIDLVPESINRRPLRLLQEVAS
jgi:hypothetical protein